jgi:hypothetical protein
MNRHLGTLAFSLGLAAVAWVGYGYLGGNPLALTMTLLIGAFYLMGTLELHRFQHATASLQAALAAVPAPLAHLGDWLCRVHPSLQNPVRLRVEGERVGLPGPAMTPYLVGLLVLLGMLGTFLGMVVTLNGAVRALESTTDLGAIRAALAAPVKGLGLAFGTSVAGVAASAMLGLMSALCRRERLQAAQQLDTGIATVLRGFSLAHQREETLQALQLQAGALPGVALQLQALMAQLGEQSQALHAQWLAGQYRFHQEAKSAYTDLAAAVDRSLHRSLSDGVRAAGAAMQPVVEATMAGIARESTALRAGMADAAQRQVDGMQAQFSAAASALQAEWAANDQQRLGRFTQQLDTMAASLQAAWREAGAQTREQQAQICQTLEQTARGIHAQAEQQARSTLDEIAVLMQAVAEAPRAAAEVMGELRAKLSDSLLRDNALLEERGRILATVGTLLEAVQQGAAEQRGAIDTLVADSAALLQDVSTRFSTRVDADASRLAAVATQVADSAADVASLGAAFGQGVEGFSASNAGLVANLQRMEAALKKSMLRSDEQLAYYVAQAREVVDLSILSQRQILEDLQRLADKQTAEKPTADKAPARKPAAIPPAPRAHEVG